MRSYSVFAERFTHLVRPQGRVGAVLPTGIATDDTTKEFFACLMESRRLALFLGMDNEAVVYFAYSGAWRQPCRGMAIGIPGRR
jgi:hypothetical protein